MKARLLEVKEEVFLKNARRKTGIFVTQLLEIQTKGTVPSALNIILYFFYCICILIWKCIIGCSCNAFDQSVIYYFIYVIHNSKRVICTLKFNHLFKCGWYCTSNFACCKLNCMFHNIPDELTVIQSYILTFYKIVIANAVF